MDEDKMINHLRSFVEKRGKATLKRARESVLSEYFGCKEVKDSMQYFMTEYWQNYSTPTLLFLAHEAAGGDSKYLTDLASAMIIINGAIDIHDDVVDHSKRKDGRLTVYGKFGKEVALLTGDALFMKGLIGLAEACQSFGIEKTQKIFDLLKRGFFELGEAEVLELEFRHRFDVRPEEYLKVMHKKAADIEALTRVGALLGDASLKEMEILGRYGRIVGLLSIVRDDIIDTILWEELKHRIKYECLPLPLLYALNDPEENVKFVKLLQKKRKTKNDLEEIYHLTQKAYGLEKTKNYMRERVIEGKSLIKNIKRRNKELRFILVGLGNFKEETET